MRRSTAGCVLLMGVLGLSGIACDDKNEGPPLSPSPNPAPPPAPVLVSLALTGNVNLSAVGETSQLTVTASYNDGTTKDVLEGNPLDHWRSARGDTVDGRSAHRRRLRSYLRVCQLLETGMHSRLSTATPPGTFVISGRVREPGQGGVLDAMITDRGTGFSAMANARWHLFSLPRCQRRKHVSASPRPSTSRGNSMRPHQRTSMHRSSGS